MTITYTNRKGVTYYLWRSVSGTGKLRYYFARDARDEPVDQLPEGYAITESVNGIVSLTKSRPSLILPHEVAAVEAQLRQHPRANNYRVGTRQNRIDIYERTGPDVDELLAMWPLSFAPSQESIDGLREDRERRANFTPVMRFILVDPAQRIFRTERMCYRSWVDGWLQILNRGAIKQLASEVVPCLGTDSFFELF